MWFRILWHNFLLYLFVILSVPPASLFVILISPFDRQKNTGHYISRWWMKLVLWLSGVKLSVSGLENLRKDGVYIFAANHQSQFDIPVLEVGLPYQIRWLAKKSLFRIPFFGWGLKAIGYIPVDRKNPRAGLKSLIAAAEKVKEGLSVVIFPEGTRSPDGKLLPFKSGGFVLAIKSGCPVVPVAVCGTREIMPKGKLYVRPGKVRVKIMPPVETRGLSLKDKEDLARRVREKIEEALSSGCL
jgi:1-acyl-sn-glycerol-3-phosphate acyltransferase